MILKKCIRWMHSAIINMYIRIDNACRGYEDYFSFPFDTSRPLPKGAKKIMEQCCTQLEALGVQYYVTDGTALGLYRENRFIPHDNDIDVDIVADNVEFDQIKHRFENDLGMHLGRQVLYKGAIQQLIYYTDDHIIFDMVFWWPFEDEYRVCFPECKNICRLAKKYFQRPYEYIFFGKKYPLHAPIEEWLLDRYGENWKVPKTEKGDWREDGNFN